MTIRKMIFLVSMVLGINLGLASETVHWSYEGETGPSKWSKLTPHFRLCGEGRNQSPVNIAGVVKAALPKLQLQGRPAVEVLINNGHTVEAKVAEGSALIVDGKHFALKQFHFHAPSENTLKGKHFPMEIHFVHVAQDGSLAVIGVFVKEGSENTALAKLWKAMPLKPGIEKPVNGVQAGTLLPQDSAYYRFNGSLTTPPCSEGVLWIVMKHPIEASSKQIATFRRVMGHTNNRPVQPLNARLILE